MKLRAKTPPPDLPESPMDLPDSFQKPVTTHPNRKLRKPTTKAPPDVSKLKRPQF